MAGFTEREIRNIVREELSAELRSLRQEMTGAIEMATSEAATTSAASARALSRLSMVVVGDDELKIPGLIKDVETLKRARQVTLLERAKLSGIWIGASVVGMAVLRALWYLIDQFFKN